MTPARRKLFALCNEAGLTRDDRLELATFGLHRDVGSFAELEDPDVDRLLDMLTGWHLVEHLRRHAGSPCALTRNGPHPEAGAVEAG